MQATWMGLNRNAMLASAAIAGVWIGLFSNMPLVQCLNCLLFAWVWLGGILAVYLYRRSGAGNADGAGNSVGTASVTVAQGLALGLLAGVTGALIGVAVLAIWHAPVVILTNTLRDFAGRRTAALTNFFFATGFSLLRVLRDMAVYGLMGAVGGLIATTLIWRGK